MSSEAIAKILNDNQRLRESNCVLKSENTELKEQLACFAPADIRPEAGAAYIGKAILYSLGRWKGLSRFLKDGRIEFSNNWIENLFRLLALGRRNYLFAGSENGAKRLAILYTILLTCKLHKSNSFKYLSVTY